MDTRIFRFRTADDFLEHIEWWGLYGLDGPHESDYMDEHEVDEFKILRNGLNKDLLQDHDRAQVVLKLLSRLLSGCGGTSTWTFSDAESDPSSVSGLQKTIYVIGQNYFMETYVPS